ncbi:recombinase family protein [Niallia sp.]|uniref:recombinase family protein n=1 Tax=Niallia sp. TaxID=2837523 RepID=UPI00289F51D1|nr:recombinase family protein [Niallia sp.]
MKKQYSNIEELLDNQFWLKCEWDKLSDKGISYDIRLDSANGNVALDDGAPYGYRFMKNHQLVLDPAEGIILATIITLVNEGCSYREICTLLNNQGVKTKKGELWKVSNIHHIVQSTIDCRGEYVDKSIMNKKVTPIYKECNRVPMDNKLTTAYLRTPFYSKEEYRINDFNGIKFYEDRGYSGLSDPFERPAFHALLEDVKNGKVKEIIFMELKSISRNTNDFLKAIEILKQYNVKLTYLGKNSKNRFVNII